MMPSRLTPLATNEYYHIFNRGINKQPLFFGLRDFDRALHILEFYSYANTPIRFSKFLLSARENRTNILNSLRRENQKLVDIICYCLMPNHFHFLLKQRSENGISKFMANFQNSITRYLNTKYQKIGPILQGQFKAVRIEDEEQLLHVSRYIHLNPYTSYILKDIEDLRGYTWSSFPEYVEEGKCGISSSNVVLSNFKMKSDYKQFVYDQADYQRKLDAIRHLVLE